MEKASCPILMCSFQRLWPWAGAKKKLSVSVAVPPAPVRAPSQRPLVPIVASVTSVASDKGDDKMKLENVIFGVPSFSVPI